MKKVKALDPNLQYPEVGLEKQQTKDLSRMGKSLQGYNKNQGVPSPEIASPKIRL
jgi:hypothetical protein